MRLTLAYHPITDIQYGEATRLEGTTLTFDQDALRAYLLDDQRIQHVDFDLAQPGESCRFGVVYDIIEPRAKEPAGGADFPGILGPIESAGHGVTHVLQGAAVSILDEAAPIASGKIVEMSGDAGAACPYAALHHLVVTPHLRPSIERHSALNALRLASVKTAVFLARAATGQTPATSEVFDLQSPVESSRENTPRIAYIGQIHSRQRVAEVDEQILYGANTTGMLPVLLHPNEWLDGAVVTCNNSRMVETYFYQNHPVITELYRAHQAGALNFVGTIATTAASDNDDRARNCMLAAQQAKWLLDADGAILTKYGGGAPHADMALTAQLCEKLGIRTTVQVSDMSKDRRAESALLFNYAEVDAIVYVGGRDTVWAAPYAEHTIAGTPAAAATLAAAQQLEAERICGVVSQQGASRLQALVY